MKTRQIIISVIGILILVGAYFGKGFLASQKKAPPKREVAPTPKVQTKIVKNTSTPIVVTASGNLAAQTRVEIFSEVQGIFERSASLFEPGTYYNKGSVLIRVNSDEHEANLRSQKSNLYNQIVAALPDLRFDFPDAYQKWEQFVADFDVNDPLPQLPEASSEKEKLFIAGRSINSTWFTVKNLEERLLKFTIYAPFSGVLTEALVEKGALIRAGQKLGTFINTGAYELEVNVNAQYADILKVGKPVSLHNADHTRSYKGKVSRINSYIDPASQTLQAFIKVNGNDLREGLYLEADLTAQEEPNTVEVERNLLTDGNKLFILKDTTLALVEVDPIFFKEGKAVVRGIADGTKLVTKPVPGAYEGMVVEELNK